MDAGWRPLATPPKIEWITFFSIEKWLITEDIVDIEDTRDTDVIVDTDVNLLSLNGFNPPARSPK